MSLAINADTPDKEKSRFAFFINSRDKCPPLVYFCLPWRQASNSIKVFLLEICLPVRLPQDFYGVFYLGRSGGDGRHTLNATGFGVPAKGLWTSSLSVKLYTLNLDPDPVGGGIDELHRFHVGL